MKIQFGTARRCITPQEPISLSGYFNRRVWDHILDDLEVRAIVFKDGKKLAAIIHLDTLAINSFLFNSIKSALKKAGLARFFGDDNLLIAATHTHTAPNTFNEPNSKSYREFAAKQAAAALKEAMGNIHPGELLEGMAYDNRFQFNRRYWMKNGHVVTNPGKLNPDILRPEGEIDPEIPLLAIRTGKGLEVLISSCVNHTDTIGGCGVSADWAGFLRRELEAEMAPGAMVIPMVGASGNINHFDVSNDTNQTCYAEAKRIGSGYAESIRAVLPELTPVSGSKFSSASFQLKVDPRKLSSQEIADALAVIDKYPEIDIEQTNSQVALTSEDLARGTPYALKYFAVKLLEIANNTRKPQFLLSMFKFGKSSVLVSLPSEPFVEIGLTVRKGIFAGKHCLLTSHGNYNGGKTFAGGYIPNPWNYGRGGYEDTPRSSGYSTDTAEKLIAAWKKLAEKK